MLRRSSCCSSRTTSSSISKAVGVEQRFHYWHAEVFNLLLKQNNVKINFKGYGQTALWCAAQIGHTEVVKLPLKHNDIKINSKDSNDLTNAAICQKKTQKKKKLTPR